MITALIRQWKHALSYESQEDTSITLNKNIEQQNMDVYDFLDDDMTCIECTEPQQCKLYRCIPESRVQKIAEFLNNPPSNTNTKKARVLGTNNEITLLLTSLTPINFVESSVIHIN